MDRARIKILAAGASTLLVACAATSRAAQISVDFQAANNGGQPAMALSESAGAAPYAQQNWNSFPAGDNATNKNLIDDAGAATGANIVWSTNNNYTVGGAGNNTAGNQKMLNGYIDTDNTTTSVFTVTNLPASIGTTYNVVVYTDGDGADNRVGDYSIAGLAGAIRRRDDTNATSIAGSFDDATSDQLGNYIVFTNVPRDANGGFVLSAVPITDPAFGLPRAPVNGIQIVAVPEPMSLGLLGLGAIGLLGRRRRS